MSPLPVITSPDTLNSIAIGLTLFTTLIATIATTQEKKESNPIAKNKFQLEAEETRFQLEAEETRFQLEAEETRFQNLLELNKALNRNEITLETFIALSNENASNIKAIVNGTKSNQATEDATPAVTEQSRLVSIDKNLSLSIDKENLAKNANSLALYADINDSDNAEFSLRTSIDKQQVVPKEQYLIGVDGPKVEQAPNTLPEQVSTVIEPRKPFQPRSRGGLPFASASLSRTPIGIRQSSLYGKGNGEEMHLAAAPPSSKSLWELERSSSSSNNVYSSLLPLALLALALIQQVLIKLNKIQKQINDLTV